MPFTHAVQVRCGASVLGDIPKQVPLSGSDNLWMRWSSLLLKSGFVVAFVLSSALRPGIAGTLEVEDIRIGADGKTTRLVVELNDRVEPHVFGLPDPYRLVIDLPEAGFSLTEDRMGDGVGIITNIRYGLFRPGMSRIVLDLGFPAKVKKQFLLRPDGNKTWRLVFDLQEATRDEFVTLSRPDFAPTRPAESPKQNPVPNDLKQRPRVVIDPGHGGVDPGAIGTSGVYEKDIALRYSHAVAEELRNTGKFDVKLTREEDVFLPLGDRVLQARSLGADLFLSFHANSHRNRSIQGVSVFTLSNRASDEGAAAMAERENRSDAISGVDLGDYSDDVQNILIDFARTKTNELSVRFARDIFVNRIKPDAKLLPRPWRSAGFAVLKAPDVPSVLIELGYMSNLSEERLLKSPAYRTRLSQAIKEAVVEYFSSTQNSAL